MKTIAFIVLSGLMCVGLYALVLASLKERDQQAAHEQHCATVNAQVIQEFDEIVGQGKFPTQVQQDGWVTRTQGCQS